MKPYRELWWPRFWPFLRVVDEMPSHRINLHLYTSSFLICGGMIWGYSALPTPSWAALIMVAAGFALLKFGPLRLIKAPPRQASNYLVTIVAKRGLPEHTLQQEIYESRYWLRHPWRLVDFFWFYVMKPRQWWDGDRIFTDRLDWRWKRWKRAAAHLSRVEAASRAQEIRAYYAWFLGHHGHPSGFDIDNLSRRYAESIHGAKNYPFIKAAGWTEEDCYNEIIKHL